MSHLARLVSLTLLVASGPAVLLSSPAQAAGGSYWVDATSGSCTDTGTGTSSAPFCTISAAAKKAVLPGDGVLVRPGVYREQVAVAGSGSAADPIRIDGVGPGVVVLGTRDLGGAGSWTATASTAWSAAYAPPSNPRQVLRDNQRLVAATSLASLTNGSWYFDSAAKRLYVDVGGANPGNGHQIEAGAQSFGVVVTGRQNVVISNLETRDQNFGGVRVLSSSATTLDAISATGSAANGILVDSSSGVVVTGATASGSLSTGIRLSSSADGVVRNSISHDNGLHGIGLSTSARNVIDGNTTYSNISVSPTATAVGIDVNTASTNNTVTRNLSHDNQDSGFQIYSGSAHALVARNVAYANGDHGFDSLNSVGTSYLNNTAYGNRRDGISVEGGSTGARLSNNVLVNNGEATQEYNLYVDPPSMSGLVADHDLAYNDDTTPVAKLNGTVYRTMAALKAATLFETDGMGFDPGFVDAAAGNFQLTPGSPATDSADAGVVGFVAADLTGMAPVDDPIVRDTGAGNPSYADRGAFEISPPPGATNYQPHAAVILDPASVNVPPATPVRADASGSSDVDLAGIASYTFDFGDGTIVGPQADPVSSHAYTTAGSYVVTVSVRDTQGLTGSARATAIVTSRPLRTYYVTGSAAACSDAGPATAAIPLCTIGAATKAALAGDTVLIGAGQYREQIRPLNSGEAGAPVTLRATTPAAVVLGSNDVSDAAGWTKTSSNAWRHAFAPAAAPTQVFLDGNRLAKATSPSTTASGSWFYDATAKLLHVDVGGANPATGHSVAAGARNFGLLLRSVSYIDVIGLTMSQQNFSGLYIDSADHVSVDGFTVSSTGSHGATVDGSTQVVLTNVEATDNLGAGVRFSSSSDSSLRQGRSHDNQYHGISVQGSQRVTISGIEAYANARPGVRVATGIDVSLGSVDTVIERNTTYGNDDSGIEAYSGSTGTVIRRNVTYDNFDHGIDSSGAPYSVVVANTVVGNATSGINFEGGSHHPTSRNNITADNAVGSTRTIGEIRVDESSAPGASLNRDLVFDSAGGPLFEWASQPYISLEAYRSASGQEPDGLAGDPNFRDLAGRDLRLHGASPAIDAAFTALAAWASADRVGAAPVDAPTVANTGSGPDATADLGAYEFTGPFTAPVEAALLADPPKAYVRQDVVLDARGTIADPSAPVVDYTWRCSASSAPVTGTAPTFTCTYATAGTQTASVTVRDSAGSTSSRTVEVKVLADIAPEARLAVSDKKLEPGQSLTASAADSTSVDRSPIATYRFDCGNGTGTGAQPSAVASCTYPKAGKFTVQLTVTDTVGLSSTDTAKVQVK